MDEKTEKPWICLSGTFGVRGIGKISEYSKYSLEVQYKRKIIEIYENLDEKEIFDEPKLAINYWFKHQGLFSNYTKGDLIKIFLEDFQEERKNLEN